MTKTKKSQTTFRLKVPVDGNSLIVQWLRLWLGAFTDRACLQSLVRELRFYKSCCAAKKKKKNSSAEQNQREKNTRSFGIISFQKA